MSTSNIDVNGYSTNRVERAFWAGMPDGFSWGDWVVCFRGFIVGRLDRDGRVWVVSDNDGNPRATGNTKRAALEGLSRLFPYAGEILPDNHPLNES